MNWNKDKKIQSQNAEESSIHILGLKALRRSEVQQKGIDKRPEGKEESERYLRSVLSEHKELKLSWLEIFFCRLSLVVESCL